MFHYTVIIIDVCIDDSQGAVPVVWISLPLVLSKLGNANRELVSLPNAQRIRIFVKDLARQNSNFT